MKKREKKRGNAGVVIGYFIFFLTLAMTVSFALAVYESVRTRYGASRGVVSLAMLGAILFIALVCTIADIIRRHYMVNRPVKKILDATKRIADGDFSVRLDTVHMWEKYDEFDLIMSNLNMVAIELEKNEVLRTDFISNVSHELKTPIAVIKNTAELLLCKLPEGEERTLTASVAQSASRLAELVGNILTLNKLENNGIGDEYTEINIGEVLEECMVSYLDKADEKEIELDIKLDYFSVLTSRTKLEIVFNNLISNAVKFTGQKGKVSISLSKDESDAVFKISDTGIGISREDGERIFEKFYQADSSRASLGTGLGLPLVKKVVSLLGGEIRVESELGKGSSFEVRLSSCVI